MSKNYSTYHKINILIFLLLFATFLLYTIFASNSMRIVRADIQTNNINQIRFLVNQLDNNVNQLSMLGIMLTQDPTVSLLRSVDVLDSYGQTQLQLNIAEKINLQMLSGGWPNQIAIYSPKLQRWIGSNASDLKKPSGRSKAEWSLDKESGRFIKQTFDLYSSGGDVARTHFLIQNAFPVTNIQNMLSEAKRGGKNDPFFYQSRNRLIVNSSTNGSLTGSIIDQISTKLNSDWGSTVMNVSGNNYLVNYVKSQTLDWYVVDYTPLKESLAPITKSNRLFYTACVLLFVSGIIASFFLYRKVQVPILELIRGVQKMSLGNYGVRISHRSNNEFDYLYKRFNEMAEQTQLLIEKVYKEKIISREAYLKQLQSQINPHFLYNCLFFINNMVRLGHDDAIVAMSHNLAEYFRYTTRTEKPLAAIRAEAKVVANYLTIQSLRMDRLQYRIDIPEQLMELEIPRLLIQPIVENSIVHGIENKRNSGTIQITGKEDHRFYYLLVEDDGMGMTTDSIAELMQKINLPLDDAMGCALWNIQQRLHIHFGEESGMRFYPSSIGGLTTEIYWLK